MTSLARTESTARRPRAGTRAFSLAGGRAFSLIEILVVVGIISILTSIAIAGYQAVLARQDLKYMMPNLVKRIDSLAKGAQIKHYNLVIEFPEESSIFKATFTSSALMEGGEKERIIELDIEELGLLKRGQKFLDYAWPEGSEEPRTFTFLLDNNPEGGTVTIGTFYSKAELSIAGHRITWKMQ